MKKIILIPLILISSICFSQKISDLPAASTPLSGTELVPTVQSGTTKKTTVQDIANKAVANSITNGVTTSAPNQDQVFDALALKADLGNIPLIVYVTDVFTNIGAGTGKMYVPIKTARTITSVTAYLITAQSSGSIFTVDINENGSSILSPKLTIDNTETNSTTAATAAVIVDTSIAANSILSFDVDQIGNGTAIGLIVIIE